MIEKHFTLELDNKHLITCIASVPYSNCIRLEYKDESTKILKTGYKCEYLGIHETPLVFMQTIEVVVVNYIELLTKRKVTAISSGNLNYSEKDIELANQWKEFLRGGTSELYPEFKQLSLF